MPFRGGTRRPYRPTMTTSMNAESLPRPLLAAGLVVPPVLAALATELSRTGGPPVADYLDRLDQAPGLYLASGMLLVAAMALSILTSAALLRLSVGTQRATPLRVGAMLYGLWAVLGPVGVSLGYTAGWVSSAIRPQASADLVEQVFTGVTYSPWATLGALVGGVGWMLGCVIVGAGLLICRAAPPWAAVLVIACPIFSLAVGNLRIPELSTLGFLLLAAGLGGCIPSLLNAPSRVIHPLRETAGQV